MILDEEGVEVGSVDEARTEALKAIAELRREDAAAQRDWNGWSLVVESDAGVVVSRMRLNQITYPPAGGVPGSCATIRPAERVQVLVDAFNQGDIEAVIEGCANDIEFAIPLYRAGDPVGPPVWSGRENLRTLLRGRLDSGVRIELLSVSDDTTSAVAVINSRKQGQIAVAIQFSNEGLAERMVAFNR